MFFNWGFIKWSDYFLGKWQFTHFYIVFGVFFSSTTCKAMKKIGTFRLAGPEDWLYKSNEPKNENCIRKFFQTCMFLSFQTLFYKYREILKGFVAKCNTYNSISHSLHNFLEMNCHVMPWGASVCNVRSSIVYTTLKAEKCYMCWHKDLCDGKRAKQI